MMMTERYRQTQGKERQRERECRRVRERAKEDERAREKMVGGVEGDEMMMEGKADTKKNLTCGKPKDEQRQK